MKVSGQAEEEQVQLLFATEPWQLQSIRQHAGGHRQTYPIMVMTTIILGIGKDT